MIRYVLQNYTFRELLQVAAEEYVWSVFKHVPGIEGVMLRRLFLKLCAASSGHGAVLQRDIHLRSIDKLSFGDRLYINRGCHIDAYGGITLGANVAIGPHTVMITNDHRFATSGTDYARREFVPRPIEVGDDSIIGSNCYVNPGVKIGRRCVIASGTSVFVDIPDGEVVGPAPLARHAKSLRTTLKDLKGEGA